MSLKLDAIELEADFLHNNRQCLPQSYTTEAFEKAYVYRNELLLPGFRLSQSEYINAGLRFLELNLGNRVAQNDIRYRKCGLGGRGQTTVGQATLNFLDLLSLL